MNSETENKPYGAWIDPKGELIIVAEECHYEKAIEILGIEDNLQNALSWQDIYYQMFLNKYLRLIFRKDGSYYLEFSSVQSITWQQKSYIKNAAKIGYK